MKASIALDNRPLKNVAPNTRLWLAKENRLRNFAINNTDNES